jgi:hypothetical protein
MNLPWGSAEYRLCLEVITPSLDAGSGVAFQVNYGRRLLSGREVALYGEFNF